MDYHRMHDEVSQSEDPMAVKQKSTIDIKMSGDVINHSRTDIAVRDLTIILDEPTARGGTNLGASPTETLIIALTGCLSVISHKIAATLEIELKDMTIDVVSKFDRRGVMLQSRVAVPFPEMEVNINVSTSADDEKIELLKRNLVTYCPISTVIRQSGTVLNENWNVTKI